MANPLNPEVTLSIGAPVDDSGSVLDSASTGSLIYVPVKVSSDPGPFHNFYMQVAWHNTSVLEYAGIVSPEGRQFINTDLRHRGLYRSVGDDDVQNMLPGPEGEDWNRIERSDDTPIGPEDHINIHKLNYNLRLLYQPPQSAPLTAEQEALSWAPNGAVSDGDGKYIIAYHVFKVVGGDDIYDWSNLIQLLDSAILEGYDSQKWADLGIDTVTMDKYFEVPTFTLSDGIAAAGWTGAQGGMRIQPDGTIIEFSGMGYTHTSTDVDGSMVELVDLSYESLDEGAGLAFEDTHPIVSINGPHLVTLWSNEESYSEYGATAVNSDGEDISGDIVITEAVDPNTPGIYHVYYDVSDADGDDAIPDHRVVWVKDSSRLVMRFISPVYSGDPDQGAFLSVSVEYDGNPIGELALGQDGDGDGTPFEPIEDDMSILLNNGPDAGTYQVIINGMFFGNDELGSPIGLDFNIETKDGDVLTEGHIDPGMSVFGDSIDFIVMRSEDGLRWVETPAWYPASEMALGTISMAANGNQVGSANEIWHGVHWSDDGAGNSKTGAAAGWSIDNEKEQLIHISSEDAMAAVIYDDIGESNLIQVGGSITIKLDEFLIKNDSGAGTNWWSRDGSKGVEKVELVFMGEQGETGANYMDRNFLSMAMFFHKENYEFDVLARPYSKFGGQNAIPLEAESDAAYLMGLTTAEENRILKVQDNDPWNDAINSDWTNLWENKRVVLDHGIGRFYDINVNGLLSAGDGIAINGNSLIGVAGDRTPGSNDFNATLSTVAELTAEIAAALNDPNNSFGSFTAFPNDASGGIKLLGNYMEIGGEYFEIPIDTLQYSSAVQGNLTAGLVNHEEIAYRANKAINAERFSPMGYYRFSRPTQTSILLEFSKDGFDFKTVKLVDGFGFANQEGCRLHIWCPGFSKELRVSRLQGSSTKVIEYLDFKTAGGSWQDESGLIAHYKFDGAIDGGVIEDSSADGSHLQFAQGSLELVPGIMHKAVDLKGENHLSFDANFANKIGDDFTISAFIKRHSQDVNPDAGIVVIDGEGLVVSGAKVGFVHDNNQVKVSDVSLDNDIWYNVVLAKEEGSYSLSVNGEEAATDSLLTVDYTGVSGVGIGSGGQQLDAVLENIKVYNRALDLVESGMLRDEATNYYGDIAGFPVGPTASYSFNNSVNDSIGGNNAALSGSPAPSFVNIPDLSGGVLKTVLEFEYDSSATAEIPVPPTPDPLYSDEFSVSLWLKIIDDISDGEKAVFSKYAKMDDSYNSRFGLWTKPDGTLSLHFSGESGPVDVYGDTVGVELSSFSPVNDHDWHYIVVTRFEDSLRLYIDATLEGEVSVAGLGAFESDRSLHLAAFHEIDGSIEKSLPCQMFNFKIWNQELSQININEIHIKALERYADFGFFSNYAVYPLTFHTSNVQEQGVNDATGTNTSIDYVFNNVANAAPGDTPDGYPWHNSSIERGCIFNGTNASLDVPINSPGDSWTASFHYCPLSSDSNIVVMESQTTPQSPSLEGDSTNLSFYLDATTSVATGPLEVDKWVHIVLAADTTSNLQSIYIDGVLKEQVSIAQSSSNALSDGLVFGKSSSDDRYSNFAMRDLRLWSRPLMIEEIRNLHAPPVYARTFAEHESLIFQGQAPSDVTADFGGHIYVSFNIKDDKLPSAWSNPYYNPDDKEAGLKGYLPEAGTLTVELEGFDADDQWIERTITYNFKDNLSPRYDSATDTWNPTYMTSYMVSQIDGLIPSVKEGDAFALMQMTTYKFGQILNIGGVFSGIVSDYPNNNAIFKPDTKIRFKSIIVEDLAGNSANLLANIKYPSFDQSEGPHWQWGHNPPTLVLAGDVEMTITQGDPLPDVGIGTLTATDLEDDDAGTPLTIEIDDSALDNNALTYGVPQTVTYKVTDSDGYFVTGQRVLHVVAPFNGMQVVLQMADDWGDGWNGNIFRLFDSNSTEVESHTALNEDIDGAGDYTSVTFPLSYGDYTWTMGDGNWQVEHSFQLFPAGDPSNYIASWDGAVYDFASEGYDANGTGYVASGSFTLAAPAGGNMSLTYAVPGIIAAGAYIVCVDKHIVTDYTVIDGSITFGSLPDGTDESSEITIAKVI